MNNAGQFLQTLHISDSSFPTGAFAYSDGLECAVDSGALKSADDLLEWLRYYVHRVFACSDGPALRLAMEISDPAALVTLDSELTALKPSSAVRASSAAQGRQFLRTVIGIHPSHQALQQAAETQLVNLPVIYGLACRALGHDSETSLLAYCYTRLAGTTSAAMRLMTIGQQQAHAALNRSLLEVPPVVERITRSADPKPAAFTPTLDIHQMNHSYVYSRLFRS